MVSGNNTHSAHRASVLALILLSYLMIILDVSIVITGLESIRTELSFSATQLSWIQSIYTLVFGGFLLLGARAGDILGRKRLFLAGLAIFTIASLGVGTAQSALWMLAGRALQGVGAAILAPATLALLQSNFEEGPERTRAVAYYGAIAGIGASIGLVLGGVLASWVSWRVGFFINLPIGIALVIATMRFVTETERHTGSFDVAGAVTSTIGMFALVFGIVRSADEGWANPLTIVSLATAAVFLAAFIVNERHAKQPIMPLRLFADVKRTGAYVARMLFMGGMVGYFFFASRYMQEALGFTPLEAGIGYLPMTLVNFGVALTVPRLTERVGNERLLAIGLAITAVGMMLLGRITVDSTYLTGVAFPLVMIGVGQGLALSPLTVAGVAGVADEDAGAASGVVNVAHQLGLSLGLSVLVVVFAAASGTDAQATIAMAHGASAVFTGSALMSTAALVMSVVFVLAPARLAELKVPLVVPFHLDQDSAEDEAA